MDGVLSTRPAGFWIRALAFAIDAVLCLVVQASFAALGRLMLGSAEDAVARPTAFFFTAIFAAAYWTTLHMVAGQTLGKSIVGVRVVGTDGALLTFGPALLRHLASGVSLALFGFGYLMAGLRRDKRALHDLIAGSRVERPIPPRPQVRRVVRPATTEPVEGTVAPVQEPVTPLEPAPPVGPPPTPVASSTTSEAPPATPVGSSVTLRSPEPPQPAP